MRGSCIATVVLAATAFLTYSLTACSTFTKHGAPSTINSIALELHSPDAPVLNAKIGGMEIPLWFDLGDSSPLTLQQSVLDAVAAVPTGESNTQQGIDGVFEVEVERHSYRRSFVAWTL